MVEDGATATVAGCARIGKDTIVHSRTTIRGPVILGEHSQIGPNVYIGPYASIGKGIYSATQVCLP